MNLSNSYPVLTFPINPTNPIVVDEPTLTELISKEEKLNWSQKLTKIPEEN
jgi:hypothetical protein